MNISEIKKQMNLSNTQTVIFENLSDLELLGKDVCALLNSGGGFVLTDISNKNPHDVQDIELNISRYITPKSLFSVEKKEIANCLYIVIEVPSGKDIPYSYNNTIFIRNGSKAELADIETIKDMVLSKQNEPIRWERRLSDAEFNSDFHEGHFIDVLSRIVKGHRFSFNRTNNTVHYLEDFSLYRYGRLTNACDVLLCINPALRFPQTRAKATLFASDKTDSEYIDLKYYEGPLLILFNELYNFILRNTPTRAYFPENNPQRQNMNLYPERAIREGLINALVHRDYSNSGGSISVSIYPDRLEIWNFGEFPEGVTLQSLDKGNVSVLRNPDIAHMLYLQDYMEKLGRGAKLIKKECADYGLPEPKWKSEKGQGVTLTFFAPKRLSNTVGTPSDNKIRIADLSNLTKQEKSIVEYIKINKRFVLKDIEALLNIKESRAREIVRNLSNKNIVQKRGKSSNTYYIATI